MKTKYAYPPFIAMLGVVIVTFVHKVTGFQLDVDLATGAVAVVANYLVVQFAADIQKIRRGEPVTGSFNSLKLITALIICVFLGVSNYLQLDFTPEDIIVMVGVAMTVITGKGLKDVFTTKTEVKPDEKLAIDDHEFVGGDPADRGHNGSTSA